MPNIPQRDEFTEFPACCETMRRYEINTQPRAAAWLANLAAESGDLFYTQEIASGEAYEWRTDLGNTQRGDGVKFKGRGYIQMTGRNNYTRIAQAFKIPCVMNPQLLEQMPFRWYTAGYFWKHMSVRGDLNRVADRHDFPMTVLGIRGGPDPRRNAIYERAMQVLPRDLVIPHPTSAAMDNAGAVDPARPAPTDLTDPAAPGEATPRELIVPRPGELHSPGSGPYVTDHPTHYRFREDVKRFVVFLLNHPLLRGKIWICTYFDHPPGWGLDTVSYDLWHWLGRGYAAAMDVLKTAEKIIMNHPLSPRVRWMILDGAIWTPSRGSEVWPYTDPLSDAPHRKHGHVTTF